LSYTVQQHKTQTLLVARAIRYSSMKHNHC